MLKKEDIAKLKTANKEELTAKLVDLKKELMNTRFQLTAGQLKDTATVKKIRRNIAQVETFLSAAANKETAVS